MSKNKLHTSLLGRTIKMTYPGLDRQQHQNLVGKLEPGSKDPVAPYLDEEAEIVNVYIEAGTVVYEALFDGKIVMVHPSVFRVIEEK